MRQKKFMFHFKLLNFSSIMSGYLTLNLVSKSCMHVPILSMAISAIQPFAIYPITLALKIKHSRDANARCLHFSSEPHLSNQKSYDFKHHISKYT